MTTRHFVTPRPVRSRVLHLKQVQRPLHIPESKVESPSATFAWVSNSLEFSESRMEARHDRQLDARVRLVASQNGQAVAFEKLLGAAHV